MSQELVLYWPTCSGCGGTGLQPIHPTGTRPCPMCDGTGKQVYARMSLDPGVDDVMDKLEDVLDKLNDILEKLNEA